MHRLLIDRDDYIAIRHADIIAGTAVIDASDDNPVDALGYVQLLRNPISGAKCIPMKKPRRPDRRFAAPAAEATLSSSGSY